MEQKTEDFDPKILSTFVCYHLATAVKTIAPLSQRHSNCVLAS
jgi:hypothetical protein